MRHSVDHLCYQLIEGEVSLKPLRVLEQQEIAWQGGRVTFSVLGASHAVQIHVNGLCLTELLTCAPISTSSRILACSTIDKYKIIGGDFCGIRCWAELWSYSLCEQDWTETFRAAPEMTVTYPFSEEEQTPLTCVGWKKPSSRLIVETVHTYPEEGRGARSRTYFRLLPPTLTEFDIEEIKEMRV